MSVDANESRQMGRKHIFVINSAVEFLAVLRELLQHEEGYNVTTTNFAPEAFDQIEALQPDLLMIDLVIGEQAGWDLLERLAKAVRTAHIPVIVFSTSPKLLEEAQAQPERFGGQRFLSKPVDIDEVLEAVHDLIGLA